MRIGIGIEGTFAPQSGLCTLGVTGHYDWARRDFELVEQLGIRQFRYPIPWHWIERERGRYEWRLLDEILARVHGDLGLEIIADPLHHTSYPAWLRRGFLDPDFAAAYVAFVRAFAERHPEVRCYTPVNEPTCTLDFCGLRGFWHPYERGDRSFVAMLVSLARATAETVRMLKARDPQIHVLHVDTFEHHAPLDEASIAAAEHRNERRFLFEELVTGRVGEEHPLRAYLLANGARDRDLDWHREHPAAMDERGGNYYPLSEEQLRDGRTFRAPSAQPRGLAAVAFDYEARLPYPLSMTETNIQGTVADRISWLKYMLEQAERFGETSPGFRHFAWYPLFDCAGWHCLLQGDEWCRDPQGIFSCDDDWNRRETELSHHYARVVEGARASDLPAYRFGARHDATLGGFATQMDWAWQDPPAEPGG